MSDFNIIKKSDVNPDEMYLSVNLDAKIWDDFKKGEKHALSHIYYQHSQHLFCYGRKFSKDEELIKDTIQDLFIDLIRTRKNLGKTDNIKYYLITSFRRKLFKNIQKQSFRINHETIKRIFPDVVCSSEQNVVWEEELKHRNKMIREALKKLTPKQREILLYRFICDFEYEQICETMSLKYDSARKQVFRALKALRRCLSKTDMLLPVLSML